MEGCQWVFRKYSKLQLPRHFPHHDRVADDEREKRRRPRDGIGEIERIEGRGGGEGRIQPDHTQQADAAQAGDGRQKGITDAAELADEGILHAEEDVERHVVAHADEAADDDRRIGVEQREQRRAERVNQQAERQPADERGREADEQLETIKKKTASFQSTQRESQKNANIWQLKCHDLQQQVDELQKQLTAARALNTAAAPAAPTSDLVREAKLEAGKILADARLYAESAERELKQQAETQKNRMAENARSIASGVMLVRERLARVDERLSAATLDLDGLTQAIYQALDQTEAELKDLGTDMRSFAQGTPETDIPAPVPPRPAAKPAAPSPEKPVERLRVKAKAQPVHHTAPAAPVHRLRNTRRPISQLLQDQIDKLGREEQ